MKINLLFGAVVLLLTSLLAPNFATHFAPHFAPHFAWAGDNFRPFESVDEAKARHSAKNYDTYKKNNYQPPLGGYPEQLGDPQPYGTLKPGYVNNGVTPKINANPYGTPQGSTYDTYGNKSNEDW